MSTLTLNPMCVCVCVCERERGAYPFPAGVPAGSGAGGRLEEPRPHLAAGLLHPLPQEPHRRICHAEFETAISGAELERPTYYEATKR
jgi:hypothetical protein